MIYLLIGAGCIVLWATRGDSSPLVNVGTLWAGIGLVMLFGLGQRTRVDISVQQDRNPVYVRLSDGDIRNGYTVKIRNMQARPRAMEIALKGVEGGRMWSDGGTRETAARTLRTTVPADALSKLRVFVAAPGHGAAREEIVFAVRALDAEGGADRAQLNFDRPEGAR